MLNRIWILEQIHAWVLDHTDDIPNWYYWIKNFIPLNPTKKDLADIAKDPNYFKTVFDEYEKMWYMVEGV